MEPCPLLARLRKRGNAMLGRAFIRVFCAALLCLTLVGVESAAAVQTNPAEDVYAFGGRAVLRISGDCFVDGAPGRDGTDAHRQRVHVPEWQADRRYLGDADRSRILDGGHRCRSPASSAPAGFTASDASAPASNCAPGYPGNCFPYPPDLDCGQISQRNFAVTGTDPHGFDADNDGIGCEQN